MRVLYFGMLGEFSRLPLMALLDAGVDVCGVMVPMSRSDGAPIAELRPIVPLTDLPITHPYLEPNIVHVAWERSIPVFEVGRLKHTAASLIVSSLKPDVACVACFSNRIPALLLALPKHGFLNLHPSLLPAQRGPEPLFWFFRSGGGSNGVTIHFMDEGLDTGDIAAQAPIDVPDGISRAEADRRLAALGGQVMVEVIRSLEGGTLSRREQPAGGSYQPMPTANDFQMEASWSARRAFNFMRGTAEWGQPYPIEIGAQRLRLASAIEYSADEVLGTTHIQSGDDVRVQFAPGVLVARTYRSAN